MYIGTKGYGHNWQILDQFQLLSSRKSREHLGFRLHKQIQYFGSRADALPEWKEAARAQSPEEMWEIWSELPILTKTDLQSRFPASEIRDRFNLKGIVSSTGGSTGEPTPYFHDSGMLHVAAANRLYCRYKMGWQPGMSTIKVWGSERDIGKSRSLRGRLSSFLRNDWMVDGYSLSDETVASVVQLLERHAPVAIYGFTSMLEFVAREVLSRGISIPRGSVKTAWNGGEMLFEEQSTLFENAFGVPLLNLYGGRELSAMAFQPSKGEALSILRPFLFLEIVDENGKPVSANQPGRLVWTSTVCRGTPFLRYEIGDIGSFAAEDQDESGIRKLRTLEGRTAGLLKLPDGKVINNLFWNHLFKEFHEVLQFQIGIQANGTILELRLIGSGFSQERELKLRNILQGFLGNATINIIWPDRIPRTSQGKLVQVVREA